MANHSSNEKFSQIFLLFATGSVGFAGPIVLVKHKGNERIGKAGTPIYCTLSIVVKIACLFSCTDRKRNYVQYEMTANKKFIIMPSTRVRGFLLLL